MAITAAIRFSVPRGLIQKSWLQILPVAGAALAYGLAAPLGGSGFIAAFVAGMTFGALRGPEEEGETGFLTDQLGELLSGVTFLVFGAVLLWPALGDLTWRIGLYAIASLTVVRMLPVAVAMLGTHARPRTVFFLGWFGPRGLASIVFAVIVVQEADLPHATTLVLTTYVTVGLSVLVHGVTAAPLASRYATWFASHPPGQRPAMESVHAGTHRWRRPARP